MMTLSYVLANGREIEEGEHYFFAQLWDGNGDAEELLESGVIYVDEVARVEFEVVEYGNDALDTIVKVTSIEEEEEEEDDR